MEYPERVKLTEILWSTTKNAQCKDKPDIMHRKRKIVTEKDLETKRK